MHMFPLTCLYLHKKLGRSGNRVWGIVCMCFLRYTRTPRPLNRQPPGYGKRTIVGLDQYSYDPGK